MLEKIRSLSHSVGGLLCATYMIAIALTGFWSMLAHIHWAVPFVLVGLASWTRNVPLVMFNLVAAAGMAVYGVAVQYHLTWYHSALYLFGPLLGLVVVLKLIGKPTSSVTAIAAQEDQAS